MTFTAPLHLALLVVLPVLWWLSLPSRPTVQTWTPHLAQWHLALAALRRRPPRLARWRFVLLALAALAAIAAAARPIRPGVPGPRRLVVVLDASASMAAVDGAGASAWSRATGALGRTFAALPPHVEVTLLRAGGSLLRRHGASARSMQDMGLPDGPLAVDLAAVAAPVKAQPDTVVWTLTDGQGQTRLPGDGALTVCAAGGVNAAVLAVRLADEWPLPTLSLAVDVVAFAPAPVPVALQVQGASGGDNARTVECAPGVVRTETFALLRAPAGGELRVGVALPGDVLAADDSWSCWLPPLPAPRIGVLVDGEAGPFAMVAAQALAEEVGGAVVPAGAGSEVGLLLVDGGRSGVVPGRMRALTFGATTAGSGEPGLWRLPVVADWDRVGPLTAGLDLSELRIEQAWRSVLPAGEPFLWADEGGRREALAVVVGDGDVASVHFAFRLQDSNLPLLAAFPQLLRRAFVRSYGAGAAPRVLTAAPGAGEQDLLRPATAPDRPLPAFGTEDEDLSPWFLLAGLCALAVRAFVR